MKTERPYQIASQNAAINALNKGINRQLNVMSTGTGKTWTEVKLIEKLAYKRGLWITDKEELIDQSALAFIENKFDNDFGIRKNGFVDFIRHGGTLDGFKIGLLKADIFKPEGNIVMASSQTLHRRLDRLNPEEFDYIVCDEAHLFMAKTTIKTLDHFSPKLLRGLTATPYRADSLPLGNIFDEQVFEYSMIEAIRDGYLCEMDAVRIKTNTSLDNVHSLAGDLNQKELSNEVNTLARNFLVADSYIKYCNGRQGIFFGVDIQHCLDLEEAFKMKGINAMAVSSNEELTGDRSEKIRLYKECKVDVLINVGILTTGFDHPNTGCIGMARPTKSKTLYNQCVGRGSRLKNEAYISKFGQNCIILDFVDNTNKHNLINAHELDKELLPEDRTFITAEKRDKLIESRKIVRKITHVQKEDEIVKLFQIPKLKISPSIRMREEATDAQLAIIKKWGYDVDNISYTKKMVSEIFNQQPASENQVNWLKFKGYDVEGRVVTIGEAQLAAREIEKRESKNLKPF